MSRAVRKSAAWRWSVASRVLAAGLGGYAVAALGASAFTLLMVRMSLMARADAVLWASFASFAVYTFAALWVFATRSATRAWAGLAAVGAPCAALLWLWAK
ncbi:MAG: DUF3649 domain-containing protein [Comamonas sp.]